jgi:hypothetical protein
LTWISYFICLKASNQSDLMQHNVPAAIFSHGTIFCVWRGQYSVRCVFHACGFSLTLHLTEPSSVRIVAKHNNMCYARQHSVRLAREMFQWRKSLVYCFDGLICNCSVRRHQLHLHHRLFHSRCCLLYLGCNRWQQ